MRFKNIRDTKFDSEILKYHAEFLARLRKNWVQPEQLELLDRIEKYLSVYFNPRMRSRAGTALAIKFEIELNYRLFERHPDQLKQVYGHELAHIVATLHYRSNASHGREWQYVMKQFGLEPERCHDMDTTGLTRKHKKFEYTCGCAGNIFKLGPIKHRRLQAGRRSWCRTCKVDLVLKTQQAPKIVDFLQDRLCAADEKKVIDKISQD